MLILNDIPYRFKQDEDIILEINVTLQNTAETNREVDRVFCS